MNVDVIEYFKTLVRETDVAYHNLINLYLPDCASIRRQLPAPTGVLIDCYLPNYCFKQYSDHRRKIRFLARVSGGKTAAFAPAIGRFPSG
jgi:hypothetical protein